MVTSEWQIKYLGIKYRLGGREVTGLDCWGLVRMVYRDELGIDIPVLDGSDTCFEMNFAKVRVPRQFDIVFFDAFPRRSHAGVVLFPTEWILHAKPDVGVSAIRIERFGRTAPDFYRCKKT